MLISTCYFHILKKLHRTIIITIENNKKNEYFKAKHREEKQRSHDNDDDNEIDEKMQSFLKM